MALPTINPTKTKAWKTLKKLYDIEKDRSILSFFEDEKLRVDKFSIRFEDILVDFSKNRVSKKVFDALVKLAEEVGLKDAIEAQFNGEIIN